MEKKSFLTLPGAIIIAGAIIAVAIIWTRKPVVINPSQQAAVKSDAEQLPSLNLRPITNKDHILGNPNAPIKLVEYSDPSCPFCKTFAPIVEKIVDTYGASGTVAWVYRNFPLDKPDSNGNILHKNAGRESQAFECAAYLGGNEKYWIYLKRLYAVTPSVTGQTPNGLDQAQLPVIAKYAGLDVVKFNDCLSSGMFKDAVEADYTDGINIGITGTPSNVLVFTDPMSATAKNLINQLTTQNPSLANVIIPSADSHKVMITGALPYQVFKLIIDAQLSGK